MLSPEYLLRVSEGGEAIAENLHNDIIAKIVSRIATRLDRGDNYILTAQDKWQIEVLQESGYLLEEIQKILAKSTGLMQTEIAEAMEDAGVRAINYDNSIYEAAGLSPAPLEQSPHLIRLMQRTYEATDGEWRNFTRTIAEEAQRSFIRACDMAYTQVASGGISYSQAFVEAVNGIVNDGVTVTYPSGHTDTIETATLRCIRTGIAQSTAQITLARMEEMDWDTILVSSHLGARVTDKNDFTNHFWWQGKFYSRSGRDSRFPPFSLCGMGHVQGIDGANCRHSIGPGDGEFNPYEQYDSEENRKEYELQQRQRTLERRIRERKRKCMGLKEGIDNAQSPESKALLEAEYQKQSALLQKRNKEYNDLCKDNDLKKLNERLTIAKWDRSQAAHARAAARKAEKSVAKQENSDILKLGTKYLNKSDPLYEYAKKIKPLDGFEDVVSHGDPFSLVFKNADGKESNVSASEFVDILKKDPEYKGGNIRLISCQAAANGGAIPKYLSREMNVTVIAPTQIVNVDFDGNIILADNDEDARMGIETGEWLVFEPGKEGVTIDLYRKIQRNSAK